MHPSSASNILKKMLMYDFAKKLQLHFCYRCNLEICNFKDISIDHVINYLHSSDPRKYFFDVNNIKFSHIRCNIKHKGCSTRKSYFQYTQSKGKTQFKGVIIGGKDPNKFIANFSINTNGKRVTKRSHEFETAIEAAKFYDLWIIEALGINAITNESLGLYESKSIECQINDKQKTNISEKQLGINPSSAFGILRKMVLFNLYKKLNLNFCYRCSLEILDHLSFSVDHKINFLHDLKAKDLFFDLTNIAFSHLSCNSSHARKVKQFISKKETVTGFRGVTFNQELRGLNKFRAIVFDNKKIIKQKVFNNAIDAAKCYDEWVIEKFGAEAITNKKLGKL